MTTEKETKSEQISELHPKDNKNVVVYPKIKSECIIDKIDGIPGEGEERVVTGNAVDKTAQAIYADIDGLDTKLSKKVDAVTENVTALDTKTENMNKVIPTDIAYKDGFTLMHDTTEITGQTDKVKLGDNLEYDSTNKKIRSKSEVEFSKVTIPSATDIITKDGSSVGGETYEYLEITGEYGKDIELTDEQFNFLTKDSNVNLKDILFHDTKEGGSYLFKLAESIVLEGIGGIYSYSISISYDSDSNTGDCSYIAVVNLGGEKALQFQKFQILTSNYSEYVDITYAKKIDLPSVWAQYRHTVTITDKTNYVFSFTTLCSKNTPIDSIQDLTSLLGTTSIACTGFWIQDGQECVPYRIDIGTAIGSCYIQYFNKGDGEMQASALSTIATGMVIQDDVTQD